MRDEPRHQTSRAGAMFVLLAVGGSAIGVAGWHLLSNRRAGIDTSGFDMSVTPDLARSSAPTPFPAAPSANAPAQQTSLRMVRADASIRVISSGASTPKTSGSSGAKKAPASPKEEAALLLKEAALKHEKLVGAFIRRMQAKHPSITRYGKDWSASPELRALRDQYWKEKNPLKFAYGLAKSKDFGKLVKKYGSDPGIRDVLITGVKEAPPGLMSAVGGVFQNDETAKGLVTTVFKAVGLPAALTAVLGGSGIKPPDQNQVMSDIMNSANMGKSAKNQPSPVPLDQKDIDKAKENMPNGFTPLGGR